MLSNGSITTHETNPISFPFESHFSPQNPKIVPSIPNESRNSRLVFFIPTFAPDLSCSNVAALKIRAYDLYIFYFGLPDLFLLSRSLVLFGIYRTLAEKLSLLLDLLSACHHPCPHLGYLFHRCRTLRLPNPRLLCALTNSRLLTLAANIRGLTSGRTKDAPFFSMSAGKN